MKVFFDATVWCAAILQPKGVNARLLDLAAIGGPIEGVTSDVVLLELYRHAVEGNLGIVFESDDVWAFVLAHSPLIDIANAPIGRSLPQRTALHNLPVGQVVYELTGKTRDDLV